jgi:hypothetical protein
VDANNLEVLDSSPFNETFFIYKNSKFASFFGNIVVKGTVSPDIAFSLGFVK